MTVDNDAERREQIWIAFTKDALKHGTRWALMQILDSRDAALRYKASLIDRLQQQRDEAVNSTWQAREDRDKSEAALREAREETDNLARNLLKLQDKYNVLLARSQPATPSPVPIQQQDIGSSVMTDISGRQQPSPEDVERAREVLRDGHRRHLREPPGGKSLTLCEVDAISVALSAAHAEGERAGIERAAQEIEKYDRAIDHDDYEGGWNNAVTSLAFLVRSLPPAAPETKP